MGDDGEGDCDGDDVDDDGEDYYLDAYGVPFPYGSGSVKWWSLDSTPLPSYQFHSTPPLSSPLSTRIMW